MGPERMFGEVRSSAVAKGDANFGGNDIGNPEPAVSPRGRLRPFGFRRRPVRIKFLYNEYAPGYGSRDGPLAAEAVRLQPKEVAQKMPPVPTLPMERIHKARAMYKEGARVRDICAATGMSVGALYHHLDGFSLPGALAPRIKRRRGISRPVEKPPSARRRQRLAARLFRAAERQAQKLELSLALGFQRKEDRAVDLAALRELTKILRELAAFEDSVARAEARAMREDGAEADGVLEHEQALAVEGRAVYVSRVRRG